MKEATWVGHRGIILRVVLTATVVAALTAGWIAWGPRQRETDLQVYHGAVTWWVEGRPLYGFAFGDRKLGFTYPPFAAVCMLPMTLLSLHTAAIITEVAMVVTIAGTTAWLIRPVARRHGWSQWIAVVVAVPVVAILEPVRDTVEFGQVNLFLAGLILFDLWALQSGRRFSGVGIGLATAIKLTPAIFIVYLLVARRWRAAGLAAGVSVAVTLVAAIIDPRTSWQFWTDTLWQTSRVGSVGSATNQSWLGVLTRLTNADVSPEASSRILLPWIAVSLLIVGVGLYRAMRAHQVGDGLAAFTLVGLTAGLVSPISWIHHLYWVVPAAVILLDVAVSRRSLPTFLGASVVVVTFGSGLIEGFRMTAGQHLAGGVQGVLGENAYGLLCLLLLAFLPYRPAEPVEPVVPADDLHPGPAVEVLRAAR